MEGKDARLVIDQEPGRFAINWLTAPFRYHTEFKSRSDDINSRKASNKLRSALLNSHEEAKEYTECQKKNAEGKISERQFQMPARIFKSLFGSDGSEQKTDNIAYASEVTSLIKDLITDNICFCYSSVVNTFFFLP